MSKFIIIHGPNIRWNISVSSPKFRKLKSIENYDLLNPYQYSQAYMDHTFLRNLDVTQINDRFLLRTTGIILRCSDDQIELKDLFDELSTKFDRLLKYLKYTSRQFDLRTNSSIAGMSIIDKISQKAAFPVIKTTGTSAIRSDWLFSHATWSNLEKADKLSAESTEIPVYEEVLLDALGGRINHEYRKTILYSTIAVESMLAHLLSKQYEEYKNAGTENSELRLIAIENQIKDPIFKALSERSEFKKLLHEIPLYLKKKSLLVDDQNLYARALKLYRTRNKIVHWGAPEATQKDQVLEINSIGAEQAILIALDIFSWMGSRKYELFRSNTVVEFDGQASK